MGKRKSSATKAKKTAAAGDGHKNSSTTLREESGGKKKKQKAAVNAKSMLKFDHMKNISLWTIGEASIPSLGAFFGNRLAQTVEAFSLPVDPNIFSSCQRCESILQPGYNCTVRIEKKKAKSDKKCSRSTQNSVVYNCHFCSHGNLKRGTPPKSGSKVAVVDDMVKLQTLPKNEVLMETSKEIVSSKEASTTTPVNTLMELRKNKRNRRGLRKTVESVEKCTSTMNTSMMSSKRKRKSWTSLKEIAKSQVADTCLRMFSDLHG